MKQEEKLERIRKEAEAVPIPSSLEPEQIMKKIDAYELERQSDHSMAQHNQEQADPEQRNQPQAGQNDQSHRSADQSNGDQRKQDTNARPAGLWKRIPVIARFTGIAAAFGVAVLAYGTINNSQNFRIDGPMGQEAAGIQGTEPAEEETASDSAAAGEEEKFRADSYDQVYQVFRDLDEKEKAERELWEGNVYDRSNIAYETGAAMDGSAVEDVAPAMPMPTAAAAEVQNRQMADAAPEYEAAAEESGMSRAAESSGAGDYSDTNVQVEGIDEGDIVKTDGSNIFIANQEDGSIRIAKADNGTLTQMGTIDSHSISGEIKEFYVHGDRLSVIQQVYVKANPNLLDYTVPSYYARSIPYSSMKGKVQVTTFDISDPSEPRDAGTVNLDGDYVNSRRSGDYLYLFASFWQENYTEEPHYEDYIPRVQGEAIPYDCIYLPDNINSRQFQVIVSIDMKTPGSVVEEKAVMADGQIQYVSPENIYIGSTKYDGRADQYNYTEMLKLSYKDGRIRFFAHGMIDGYLNNQFSMDEYQGNLRVVTTLSHRTGVDTNSLYIMDKNLEKIGAIEDLAPDEQIYSARFMGDIGYFVTFRNMDPLFSVDLSDPENPKVLGELKITGFSEYLHPFDENLLLGIGQERDPDSGNFKGVKLSMFDTSNPKNVKEIQKVVEAEYENTTAWDNHKAVLVSSGKNLIGMAVEVYDKSSRTWSCEYVVYSYDKAKGFQQEMAWELPQDSRQSAGGYSDYYMDYIQARGLYIGDYLYITQGDKITSFDMEAWKMKDQLKLN